MCTAVSYKTRDHYFGRNLDLEYSYKESVSVTPRNYPFRFRRMGEMTTHYAMIGMAYVSDGYPLYYEATNERGLSIAGLAFAGNADYKPYCEGKDNVTPFELIPWVLGRCGSVSEARVLLQRINLLNENFAEDMPLSPLHWIISDSEQSITLESLKEGIRIYDNPVGVLTNNPTFDYHLFNLNNYASVSRADRPNTFAEALPLQRYSRGMGAMGLPGDASSMSRFVRASFVKMNSLADGSEEQSVSQFFHVLRSVEMQRGCVELEKGVFEITVYSCCCNTDRGIYYYTTYDNSGVSAVDMHREDLDGTSVIEYPLLKEPTVTWQN